MKRIVFANAAVAGLLVSTPGFAIAAGTWTDESIPPRENSYSLLDTTASGNGTAWAFGGWYPDPGQPNFHSQAYRRTVESWEEVPVPNIGRLSGSAVVSRDDAWAVGHDVRYGGGASVHWDGRQWTEVPFAPPQPKHRLYVNGMTALGADVWAVGSFESDDPASEGRGMVQHWDGKAWTDVPVPEVTGSWSLSGISGTASNDLWAVGDAEGAPGQGVALHWDGAQWKQVPVPEIEGSPTQDVMLHDVVALSPDDAWASGALYSYDDNTSQPIMLHWDGREWARNDVPAESGRLRDLVRVGDQLWAVGETVLRYDGTAWHHVDGPPNGSPTAGTALDDGRLLTVGSTGPDNKKQPFVSVYND